ncbi:MAG: glycosyltransferase family 39 protein [Bacteroidetes bacterium]|nr:glycosyltransferase family 39 protein [Bacteroidota bacterium]MBU1717553.1 glycosyltransferase family 39 protein [Bacteroidota bacterium]
MIPKIANRIEFWIVLFFLVRLIGITNPPIEPGHSWRQVTGLMVARNYLEVDANIIYPRVDDNKGETGIIGMEFPVMNYLYFSISKVFGYTHWYGRLINLIISSLGLLYFYKLIVQLKFSCRTAFLSTIILAGSIWFCFSRKMMPDTFCISLMFIGLYYGIMYLQKQKVINLMLYIVISSVAILSKIPAGIYILCLVPLFFGERYNPKAWVFLGLATLIPIVLAYNWYFIWNPKLAIEYGNWYNIGKPIREGILETGENIDKVFRNFYFHAFSGYSAFLFFIIGLFVMFFKKEKKLIVGFFVLFSIFVVYILKSGFFFYHHNYYIIPFVPVMALIAGYACSFIKPKWLYVSLLVVFAGEGIANQQHDFFVNKSEVYKLKLENIADSISQKNDLILINGNENPQLIYLAHRKGWTCTDMQLLEDEYIHTVSMKGCKYIFVNKHTQLTALGEQKIFEDEDFAVYETKTSIGL